MVEIHQSSFPDGVVGLFEFSGKRRQDQKSNKGVLNFFLTSLLYFSIHLLLVNGSAFSLPADQDLNDPHSFEEMEIDTDLV